MRCQYIRHVKSGKYRFRTCGIAPILALLILLFPVYAFTCDISLATDGDRKNKYLPGEVIVLKVRVVLEHRNCDVDINKTAIHVSGGQITAATDWVNTSGKTWERKIKVRLSADKTGRAVVTARRTCDRDGGEGKITLDFGT